MTGAPPGGRSRLLVLLAVLVAVAAGCQADVEVGLAVTGDGSGEVAVAVALDEAAADRVPALADQLEVADLAATGWTVTGPAEERNGRTWVRATKPFATPEEATRTLGEISGGAGAFRDLRLARDPTVLHDTWRFSGTVDLTAGLATFSDDALRARLDGTDVGWTEEQVVAIAGRPVAEVFTFRVAVDLPGRLSSNAPDTAAGAAVWAPRLGERVALVATGRELNVATLAWFALAGVVLLGVTARCVLGAGRERGRRRYRTAGEHRRREDRANHQHGP